MASDFIDAAGESSAAEAWRRGLASAAALVAAVALIALVLLVAQSNRERDAAAVQERRSYEVMLLTRALDGGLARSEAILGRFVISGDKQTGGIYYDEWSKAGRMITRLEQLTRYNSDQTALMRELSMLYERRGRELAEPATRANYDQGMNSLSLYYKAGTSPTIARIDAILAEVAANERGLLRQRAAASAASADLSNLYAGLLSGLGALFVLGAIVLGWTTIQALAVGRLARRDARAEAERAETLEQAVAERTHELSDAYERLRLESEERVAAEAKLRQVQKMEAVGQLTGGIAHDFNNMLAVVVGGLDLARRRLSQETTEVGRHIDNAMEGANRAAALTRRLLAFARSEPLLPEGLDPVALIADMSELFDRTLGERIAVEVRGPAEPWQVWCDPNQLENALLNLAVNARDAMEGEGRLIIATTHATLAAGQIGEAPAGEYVCIAVTDDGCGMSSEVLDRVFEPFFTTKPVGKGTGLGLSQTFGFVRQSGGDVAIDSALGMGTTVSLYLPRFLREVAADRRVASRPVVPTAPDDAKGATVLVVEDDVRVRAATIGGLEELGYKPVSCGGGEEAVALLAERADIQLVITDVVMPGMTGPELIARIAPERPDLGILFVTGYVGDAGDAERFAGHEILRKPFTVSALEAAVATALVRARGRAVAA